MFTIKLKKPKFKIITHAIASFHLRLLSFFLFVEQKLFFIWELTFVCKLVMLYILLLHNYFYKEIIK